MIGEKISILVAGDNPSDLKSLTVNLRTEGFKVLQMADRTEILTMARSEVPNLILLDLEPCFDICRLLKRNFVTEIIPIIAILSGAEESDRVAVLELGADDCMAKPFHFRELTLRISSIVVRAHQRLQWPSRGLGDETSPSWQPSYRWYKSCDFPQNEND